MMYDNMTKKIAVCIIVFVIIFGIGCIDKENVYKENMSNNKTDTTKEISRQSEYSNYDHLNYPNERIIILRMDDVQGYTTFTTSGKLNNTIINITDTILKRNMSITLGVIPYRKIDDDKIIYNYLIGKTKDPRIEIAQHGTDHSMNELLNLSEYDTYDKTKLGLEELINTFGVRPITYIPPFNEYNENTTRALSRLGFKILSAGLDEYRFDGNMFHIGINTAMVKKGDELSVSEILDRCKKSLDKKNICVIMIHPQDLTGKDKNIDENKYREFLKLLDGLEMLDARFATFKDTLDVINRK